jgi:hypothetical protein
MKNILLKIIVGVVLLVSAFLVQKEFDELAKMMDRSAIFYDVLQSILYILFGILVEFERLKKIFVNKEFKIDLIRIILTLALFIFAFLPAGLWILWFGIGGLMSFNPLLNVEIKAILTVLLGILLIRSFHRKEG